MALEHAATRVPCSSPSPADSLHRIDSEFPALTSSGSSQLFTDGVSALNSRLSETTGVGRPVVTEDDFADRHQRDQSRNVARLAIRYNIQWAFTVVVDCDTSACPYTYQDVLSELRRHGLLEKVKTIRNLGSNAVFAVGMLDEQSATRLCQVPELKVKGKVAFCKSVKKPATIVRLKWLPTEVPDRVVEEYFSQFGKVKSVIRLFCTEAAFCHIELMERKIVIELSDNVVNTDLPDFINVGGYRVAVAVAGRPPVCLKCFARGHIRMFCPLRDPPRLTSHPLEDTASGPSSNMPIDLSSQPHTLSQGPKPLMSQQSASWRDEFPSLIEQSTTLVPETGVVNPVSWAQVMEQHESRCSTGATGVTPVDRSLPSEGPTESLSLQDSQLNSDSGRGLKKTSRGQAKKCKSTKSKGKQLDKMVRQLAGRTRSQMRRTTAMSSEEEVTIPVDNPFEILGFRTDNADDEAEMGESSSLQMDRAGSVPDVGTDTTLTSGEMAAVSLTTHPSQS